MTIINKQWTSRLAGTAALALGLALPMLANADHRYRGYSPNGAAITINAKARHYNHKRYNRAARYIYPAPSYSYYVARPYGVVRAPSHRHYHSRNDWRYGRYCDDYGHRRFDRYYTPSRVYYQRH